MEILKDAAISTIINESLKRAMSYTKYREVVTQLVSDTASTGELQDEEMANYTMLNDKRMKRWDKTLKISEAISTQIKNVTSKQTWIVLTESWCGDAAHLLPVMNKVAELNDTIEFKVVLRDENEELMNHFLTHGGKSIPKLVMVDTETLRVKNTFGPRPIGAIQLVTDYKEKHGEITAELKEDLQGWYNKDKGQSTIAELAALMQ
ncbi:thioredoxin family protein [Bizionia gelidisalsuginis]|uniref:Thioredoxin family protein n=1 Tax=Bizionia gelidisalsuginis TaxID=291188 RepID=A0ABY3M8E2_9FLAO|nr:thioredoxin family protein [Bizionia gelidisalsuginis]TYC10189.1 thioredoxin family protein [Bizionia gelidisalsuginis]